MDRLFLDANVLFSAAYRPDAGLLQFWSLKRVILCSSRYAFEEAKVNLSESMQRRRLAQLARKIQFFDAPSQPLPGGVSLPEKDVPVLLAALQAHATHLVTGDVRHFGRYFGTRILGILVVSPSQYMNSRLRAVRDRRGGASTPP
jgi:uncharacterized protein